MGVAGDWQRTIAINKTGNVVPLYQYGNQNKLGQLNNREAFIVAGGEGDYCEINFLNSSGKMQMANCTTNGQWLPVLDYDNNVAKATCMDYPYGTVNIDGNTYKTFIMRKTKNIYTPSGAFWKTVSAGHLVATDTPAVGDSHPDWKLIKYYQDASGKWVRVNGNYGFVDTGIENASGYSSIAFYGSW